MMKVFRANSVKPTTITAATIAAITGSMPVNVSGSDEGGDPVALGQIPPHLLKALEQRVEVDRQCRHVAHRIRDEAARRAPRRTGRTARSLAVESVPGRVEYRVGWRRNIAFWGGLVERGTDDTRAQPHLVPAARSVAGAAARPPGNPL